ncbi:TRAP transporter small permease [Roseovarius sp. MMSF_3281]|uniref:TRAP transporter small permease n=1 Tax=Roseovarius sp. MMSF_3281 TaxID=3046694 RepID=UPI00273FD486|nr:TRAP transporter small permease [Roseovarius sp. MMSF_3281]
MSGFTGWLLFAMMLILVADFVARLFGWPLQDMAQISVFVMMIVIYLGFSRCEEHHDHVGLEFLANALPDAARRRLAQFSQVLAVLTVCLLLYAAAKNAGKAYVDNEAIAGAVQIPTWPTKFIMVLGLVVFLVQAILNIATPPGRGEVETPDGGYE